jgi:glycerophosphoryl diester phosphodiesterase
VARAGPATPPGGRGIARVEDLTFPLVIAHRGGVNLFPENTMAAYEGAAALGCQAIEAGDLQLTADGVLVAMHDTTVDRTTTGRGNVGDFTLPKPDGDERLAPTWGSRGRRFKSCQPDRGKCRSGAVSGRPGAASAASSDGLTTILTTISRP